MLQKCKVATHWVEEVRVCVCVPTSCDCISNLAILYISLKILQKFKVKSRPVLQTATESGSVVIRTVDQSRSADHLANAHKDELDSD